MITHEFVTVNFLPVYDTKHLKLKVKKFEANSVVRIDEYTVWQISTFKSQFCNVLFTKCREKSEKRSNFVLEKSGKPQSDFCTKPGPSTGSCLHFHSIQLSSLSAVFTLVEDESHKTQLGMMSVGLLWNGRVPWP